MFREMRRSPQALSGEEIKELLEKETRGVLSVQGDDGYPYGVPLNHYYDEENKRLVFHGSRTGHRVDAIKRNPKVSYCVFGGEYQKEGDWAKYVKSVIVFGRAEIIENADEIRRICRKIGTKFPCPQEYIDHEINVDSEKVLCFAVNIENISGKLVHEA